MATNKNVSRILKKRAKKEKKGILSKIFLWFFLFVILIIFSTGMAATGIYLYLSENLPKISRLSDYQPPVITTVYSDDNRKIAEFYHERRIIIPFSEIPPMLTEAFLAAEDARFYVHKGIDFLSIVRAFFKNIEAGTIVQGGSTITQQVAKSFLLTPERSYTRKAKEALLAYKINKAFTKENILFLYLNQIYLGHGAYGVEAASGNYFGKSVKELNLAESAMLAGLPQAPSRYSPFKFPKRAKQRQIYVLNRMVAEGYITNIQATEAINTRLDIKPRRNWYIEEVPYYTEYTRRYIDNKYGEDVLYDGGLQIYTAVNIGMQKIAIEEINNGLMALDKRQGYRGPLKNLAPGDIESFSKEITDNLGARPLLQGDILKGVVIEVDDKKKMATVRIGSKLGTISIEDMKWARKPDPETPYFKARIYHPGEALKTGDVILVKVAGKIDGSDLYKLSLEQTPASQSALLSIEAETGLVKVMVGGKDFKTSQFNRAVQSRRQPGSAFKPVIYAAAIDKGFTPASVIIDSPIVLRDVEHNFTWKPRNYKDKFYGPTLFRKAFAQSRNVVTIKILQSIGIDYAIEYANRLGVTSNLSRDLSIALGSSGLSLLEVVTLYSVFNNRGYLVKPVFITKILDRNGEVLEENLPDRKRVIDKSTAYIMTSLLESAVKHGTGYRVRALKRPVAGKTGTTNNLCDAWFVGYTPRYTTGVWVGFDEGRSLGESETGSRAASPIWLAFMKKVLADKPVRIFQVPEGVVFSKIDAETGLLPIPESNKVIFECFKEGTVPTEYTKKPDSITEEEDFFKSAM
ncbi:MAG: penicillin-binding protein 1A [Deltaproteobacteria bacterium]|nr:penicillin-binding protein 1A [Deltaproteobacteria bacterium]